jgi:hypothetical protein
MDSSRFTRLGAVIGVAAIATMGGLTAACGGGEKKAPETSTTTTTTATTSAAAPTEKSINPTGGNLFTPPVQATPAPNVSPGQHPGLNGNP